MVKTEAQKHPVKELFVRLNRDDVWTMSAALAFYMASAIVPLFLLLASCLAYFNFSLNEQLLTKIRTIVGDDAANLFLNILTSTRPGLELKTAVVGIISLAITSSVIFAQLETAFAKILVRQRARRLAKSVYAAIKDFFRNRALALAMITFFVALILGLLYLSARYNAFIVHQNWLTRAFSFVAGLVGFTGIFALIFKTLSAVPVQFKLCLRSGLLTAAIFLFGKSAISFYVKTFAVSSAYGAAGFPIALFFWLYYSSFAIFLGAETLGLNLESQRG